jgi:lipid-binding SYLF domain-containing protein
MRRLSVVLALLILGTVAPRAVLSTVEAKRIHEAGAVLRELRAVPDRDIPQNLWENARCVIVFPSVRTAVFIVGGEYGKGLMSCRRDRAWSSPVFMQLGRGRWGLPIGGESIDFVLLVMSDRGMQKMLRDQVSLGSDASVAGGPVGRMAQAATHAQLRAELLSYSRAQGLFTGTDLSGAVLKPDDDDNHDLYGRELSARRVANSLVQAPAATRPFMTALTYQTSGPAAPTNLRVVGP